MPADLLRPLAVLEADAGVRGDRIERGPGGQVSDTRRCDAAGALEGGRGRPGVRSPRAIVGDGGLALAGEPGVELLLKLADGGAARDAARTDEGVEARAGYLGGGRGGWTGCVDVLFDRPTAFQAGTAARCGRIQRRPSGRIDGAAQRGEAAGGLEGVDRVLHGGIEHGID